MAATVLALISASVFPRGCWIFDTGCTRHLTPFKTDFVSMDFSPTATVIAGVNPAASLSSTGTGTVSVSVRNSHSTPVPLVLSEALLVPQMPMRLFSGIRALRSGCSVALAPIISPQQSVIGFLKLPDGKTKIPIHQLGDLLIIRPIATGFDSAEFTHAFPASTVLPATVDIPPTPPCLHPKRPCTTVSEESFDPTEPEEVQQSAEAFSKATHTTTSHDTSRPFAAIFYNLLLVHLRHNHASPVRIRKTTAAVTGSPPISKAEKMQFCEACVQGSCHHHATPKHRQIRPPRDPNSRLLHSDWWGPYNHPGKQKQKYIQVFIDDASGYVQMFCSPTKASGAAHLRRACKILDELTGRRASVKVLRSDSDVLYTSGHVATWCDEHGIIQQFSAPYSQQENGRSERMWRTMETAVASMFCYSGAPLFLWPYAVNNFCHSHNVTVSSAGTLTPYELLTTVRPNTATLRVWGCPALAFLEKQERDKFTAKCLTGINLGPDKTTKAGYFVYFPGSRRVHTTRHVTFDELWRARSEYYKNLSKKFPSLNLYPPILKPVLPNAGPHEPAFNPVPPSPSPDVLSPPSSTASPSPPSTPAPAGRHAIDIETPLIPPGQTPNNFFNYNSSSPSASLQSDHVPSDSETDADSLTAPLAQSDWFDGPTVFSSENPDGPNTNTQDKRSVPITPENDSADVAFIERETYTTNNTNTPFYVTHWAPSYNMTLAALESRTAGRRFAGETPFKVRLQRVSAFDPGNFDIEWEPSIEALSTFLLEDGSYLDVLTEFVNNAGRSSRRARTAAASATAYIATACILVSSVRTACTHAFFASPTNFQYDHLTPPTEPSLAPENCYPAATDASASKFITGASSNVAYCFATIVLPSGSTPHTYRQALASVDARHWRFATEAEHSQLEDALTWDLVSRTEAQNVISGKWVFKIKKKADGSIERWKARWVARGFSQKHGIDFTEIFAPTIRYSSLRLLLSLANSLDLHLYGLDVSNAFARADVDESLFVEQPHGFVKLDDFGKPYVCKLKKGLYGTKQAARLWNQKFRRFLLSQGWRQHESDPCTYQRTSAKYGTEFLGVYVDDICHACPSKAAVTRARFTRNTGHAFIPGLNIRYRYTRYRRARVCS